MKEELLSILQTMDTVMWRFEKEDWAWFGRNLRIRNNSHPQIERAMQLCKQLWREQNQKA